VVYYLEAAVGSPPAALCRLGSVPPLELVIFDCDGVLVDSERLAVRTEALILEGLGWPLSSDEIIERFVGRSAADMQTEVEAHLGHAIDWATEFEQRYQEVFEVELVAVDGIVDALDRITIATCVASSGGHDKLRYTLGLTALLGRFEGRIYSATDVQHGKPAPDVFLYVAEQMGVAPTACAVVEDSVAGVTAGLAAGMSVFAFGGGVTDESKLRQDGVIVFRDMRELPELLQLVES
jgi:HAD superfamily hydrolase (TIGR01509 family)